MTGNGTTTYLLVIAVLVTLLLMLIDRVRLSRKKKVHDHDVDLNVDGDDRLALPDPPGPKPWPIIGNLYLLARYDVPYKAFAPLSKIYGSPIIKLRMGSVPCIVVNGLENIKDVLYNKSVDFDSRPNFERYNKLFHGDKENSLAFCDWSEVQRTRRKMLTVHTFPHAFDSNFGRLDRTICAELENLLPRIDGFQGSAFRPKSLILQTSANIFTSYFCSKSFDPKFPGFEELVSNFDKIFFEVNQGYAADFIQMLLPLHYSRMAQVGQWAKQIRDFMEENVIEDRYRGWSPEQPENDYVDSLVNYVKSGSEPFMSWNMAMFALEDIVGGHAAIGNLLMKILGFLAPRPDVQRAAQEEIDRAEIFSNIVTLEHRSSLPYTESIIFEAIRLIASPIVPHVSSRDTSLAGYKIEKDTLVFLNNYELNTSEDLWESPEKFQPQRFVKNGRICKPEHFLPFGGGRRSCMGYKMVQYIGFATLATILKNYTIVPVPSESYSVPVGNLALPEDTFGFHFEKRR